MRWILASIVFLGSAILISLAAGWLPGVPDTTQRSLAIYYQPGADKADLSVFVHPPMSTIQVGGESQRLAFEFSNNKSNDVLIVGTPTVLPSNCFRLDQVQPGEIKVEPRRSMAVLFDLTALSCSGQHPLIFRYTWKIQGAAATAPVSEQSISTGPIRITSRLRIRLERFFSILARVFSLFLIPVLLAAASLFFQHFQDKKAELQKEQEQKLEVWKTILPGIITAIKEHYIPILRLIAIMMDETSKTASNANGDDILVSSLLMRRKITDLTDTSGGFYFRNNRGEELCANLTNLFMEKCYHLAGNDKEAFQKAAEALDPKDTLNQAKTKLAISSVPPGAFNTMCATFKTNVLQDAILRQMTRHLDLIQEVLNYEANGPFYPWWYDEPPLIDKDKLTTTDIGLSPAEASTLQKQLDLYKASIP